MCQEAFLTCPGLFYFILSHPSTQYVASRVYRLCLSGGKKITSLFAFKMCEIYTPVIGTKKGGRVDV